MWECDKYPANSPNGSRESLKLAGQGADRRKIGCGNGIAFAQPVEICSFLVAPSETRLDADDLAIRVLIPDGRTAQPR
jgi:hypothetical protein